MWMLSDNKQKKILKQNAETLYVETLQGRPVRCPACLALWGQQTWIQLSSAGRRARAGGWLPM